jgi:hypothetical protein
MPADITTSHPASPLTPRVTEKREQIIRIMATTAEKRELRLAAAHAELPVAEYVRNAALEKARHTPNAETTTAMEEPSVSFATVEDLMADLNADVEPDQQKALLEAAQRANLPLATWVRVVALQAAQFTPAETNPAGKSE